MLCLNKLLVHYSSIGNAAKVKLLLALGADPKANDALFRAAYKGHTDCVKLLIHVSDPDDYSRAAEWAHIKCVKFIKEAINE